MSSLRAHPPAKALVWWSLCGELTITAQRPHFVGPVPDLLSINLSRRDTMRRTAVSVLGSKKGLLPQPRRGIVFLSFLRRAVVSFLGGSGPFLFLRVNLPQCRRAFLTYIR